MSYETAPATQMLATQCAACGRPLVDAQSVETGMGPDCRKKYGYGLELPEEQRLIANSLIYLLALEQTGPNAATCAEKLRALGFTKLAERVLDRVVDVTIEAIPDGYRVYFAYSEDRVWAIKQVPGRRWDNERKGWYIPAGSKRALLHVLYARHFQGAVCNGPKGVFVIPNGGRKEAVAA